MGILGLAKKAKEERERMGNMWEERTKYRIFKTRLKKFKRTFKCKPDKFFEITLHPGEVTTVFERDGLKFIDASRYNGSSEWYWIQNDSFFSQLPINGNTNLNDVATQYGKYITRLEDLV
jgi:hypothetical protein